MDLESSKRDKESVSQFEDRIKEEIKEDLADRYASGLMSSASARSRRRRQQRGANLGDTSSRGTGRDTQLAFAEHVQQDLTIINENENNISSPNESFKKQLSSKLILDLSGVGSNRKS